LSFDSEVVKDGRGRALRVDVSLDSWATVYARWGDVAGWLDGANQYDARIVSLGTVRRSLGQHRIAASSSTELMLDNADGAIDWICGRESLVSAAKARFRIYVTLYDPSDVQGTIASKLLGDFSLVEWPRQTDDKVFLPLNDDILGRAGQGCQLPTLLDWSAVGTDETNPLKKLVSGSTYEVRFGVANSVDPSTQVQLAFGEDWVLAMPHILTANTTVTAGAYRKKLIVPVCCTTDTNSTSGAGEATALRVELANSPYFGGPPTLLLDVPQEIEGVEIWRVERSPSITKGGKTFRIIYLVVEPDFCDLSLDSYGQPFGWVTKELTHGGDYQVAGTTDSPAIAELNAAMLMFEHLGGYSGEMVARQRLSIVASGAPDLRYARIGSRVLNWYVKGYPLSARTHTSDAQQHAVDVMADLAQYYSEATSFSVDSTQAARVKTGNASARCAGVVQPWVARANNPKEYVPPPPMRAILTKLAQSSDCDAFISWSGQLSFAADVRDYTAATTLASLVSIAETRLSGVRRWVPGQGERGAPYNRISMRGGKSSPADGVNEVPYQGPWNLQGSLNSSISADIRLIEAQLEQGWRPFAQQRQAPWYWRQLDVTARERIRFRTDIEGLRLELGQYFKLTWTRGLGGPYVSAVVQCEGLLYSSADDVVEVEAVWCDDLQTEASYLLDDESLLVRAKSGSGPLYVDDTNIVDASAGGSTINFITMGVEVGDFVVVRDSSVAAGSMKRQCARRITSVFSSQVLLIDTTYGYIDPDGGTTIAAADWYVARGATTMPTAVSDPTNYPDGSDMYGAVTEDGVYSDASAGNRLLSG